MLTHIHTNVTPKQVARTFSGMAHWAGTGPSGKTCLECVEFAARHRYKAAGGHHAKGEIKPARCRKYTRLMAGLEGKPVPHYARACRHFLQNPSPPQKIKTRE